jgi:hypothetical protein
MTKFKLDKNQWAKYDSFERFNNNFFFFKKGIWKIVIGFNGKS